MSLQRFPTCLPAIALLYRDYSGEADGTGWSGVSDGTDDAYKQAEKWIELGVDPKRLKVLIFKWHDNKPTFRWQAPGKITEVSWEDEHYAE